MELRENETSHARERHIDLFKGILIILIVVTHFAWEDEERLRYLFPFWIDMAVPLFMMISGYAFVRSFQKSKINSLSDAYSVKNVLPKVMRFTIPFFIAFMLEEAYFLHKDFHFSMGLVKDLFFCFLQGGVGFGSYYYPIMIQFIFVFPVIYFIVKKHELRGVVIVGIVNAAYELLQRAYGMNDGCYRLLLFRYLLLIAAGCYVALTDRRFSPGRMMLAFACGLFYIVAIWYLGYQPKIMIYWIGTSWLACLYVIPWGMLGLRHLKGWHCKPLEILGKASFHVFLTQMVWYACISWKVTELVSGRITRLLLALAASLVLGVIFYYVETLITKWLNGKIIGTRRIGR